MVVKRGKAPSGASWEINYQRIDGEHCLELTVDGGRVTDVCGFDIPETTEVGFGGGLTPGKGDFFLFGVTSARVASMVAESEDGNSEVETEDLPGDPDFRFFAITRPPADNVNALVGLDSSGDVVQRIPLSRP